MSPLFKEQRRPMIELPSTRSDPILQSQASSKPRKISTALVVDFMGAGWRSSASAADSYPSWGSGGKTRPLERREEEDVMKVRYERGTDSAYIYIADRIGRGGVAKRYPCDPIEVDGMINLDFDAEGRLIGLEVLSASLKLPKEAFRKARGPFLLPPWARPKKPG